MTGNVATAVHQDGFCVVDAMLSRRDRRRIRHLISEFGLPRSHEFFASPAHRPGSAARSFDLSVRAVIARSLTRILPHYEPFMIAVTSKGGRSPQSIKMHQDWTYTDERTIRPIFLWCPLVDTTPRNGTLRVVPGSHRWTEGIRPSRRIEVTEAHLDRLTELSLPIDLRAGQALAFDPAMIHGSPPNEARRGRPAFTIAVAPVGAKLVHFHETDDGSLVGGVVDDAFFTTHPYGTAPTGYPALEPWDRQVTAADLGRALDAVTDPVTPR